MQTQRWLSRVLSLGAVVAAVSSSGCKTLTERYISLEVWKYERCFGHLPPGFVPPGAATAAPQARPCAPQAACQSASPCAGAEAMAGENCNSCQGGSGNMEGGLPAGAMIVPGGSGMMPGGSLPGGAGAPILPSGPGGAPGPVPSTSHLPTPATPISTSRPIVISDEVVLP